jgi:hypothetical protein
MPAVPATFGKSKNNLVTCTFKLFDRVESAIEAGIILGVQEERRNFNLMKTSSDLSIAIIFIEPALTPIT